MEDQPNDTSLSATSLTALQRAALIELLAPRPLDANFEKLWSLAVGLSPVQLKHIVSVVNFQFVSISEDINSESDLVGQPFAEEFGTALRLHHATQNHPLEKTHFEHVLANSIRAEGHSVSLAPSKTTRFWDLEIDGSTKISAKTSSAKSMKVGELHISKLCEAAWIQDVRSARQRRTKTIEHIREYLSTVGRSIYLRTFERPDFFFYELVEVPRELFTQMLDLPLDAFNADGPTIDVRNGDDLLLGQLKLDRSDSKITIAKISKSNCVVHATWSVPRNGEFNTIAEF